MKELVIVGSTLAALSTIAALPAYAAKPHENDALVMRHSSISLMQAVQTAEQHIHGKAVRAELEQGKQGWVFDVEVVAGNTVYDVAIDASKGTVLTSVQDKSDQDDTWDKKD